MTGAMGDPAELIDELERAGLLEKNGQMRRARSGELQPAYVATEWSRRLNREHPALLQQIIKACDDPDALKRIFEANKAILRMYRQ